MTVLRYLQGVRGVPEGYVYASVRVGCLKTWTSWRRFASPVGRVVELGLCEHSGSVGGRELCPIVGGGGGLLQE